jgi:hypothetical protein
VCSAVAAASAGVPVLTYTAAGSSVPELGNYFQQQAAAVPADLSDPLLKKWQKLASNPFLTQVCWCKGGDSSLKRQLNCCT